MWYLLKKQMSSIALFEIQYCFESSSKTCIFWCLGGDAPKSLGDKQYYVSLIDDYSKLSRIYSLKFKSEVFHKFVEL